MDQLALKRAAASRLSGEWSEDDYDVMCEGAVVGRIMKAAAAPIGQPHADPRLRGNARSCNGGVR
jgi:hypothetical protein